MLLRGKNIISTVFVFLFFMMSFNAKAQLKKANKYFELAQYKNAITAYQKVIKNDEKAVEAIQNIAFSYRKLKDYANAEKYYAIATQLNPNNSANYLYYGQVLKSNNKVKEAKIQFEKFVVKAPNNFIGKLMVQSCDDVMDWIEEEKEFEVFSVPNINTKDADFCPQVYKDGLVFVSERGIDLVNESQFGMSNKPYLSVYYASDKKEYEKAKSFSSKINSLYHDGPVCIATDGKTIYFTRAQHKEKGKEFINRLKIYSAQLDGKKWKDVKPLPFNSDTYSVAHPWISENGNQLFFSSNMEGGQGGMDLYVVTKEGDSWSNPVNLGNEVNTSGNEVFPYYRNGLLYFSSDGLSGYGGLDIYVVDENAHWESPKNLKAPLNSSKDDFGIFYKDNGNGYFSSDRNGGMGSDDIYRFTWKALTSKTLISGIVEFDKLPSAGSELSLLDENDNIVQTALADKEGKFKFEKLDLDQNYMIRLEESDDSQLNEYKVYLTNSKGEKVLLANSLGEGKFTFRALPYAYYDDLELLSEVDESLFTVSIFGQLYQILPGDYSAGMEVLLLDDEGHVVETTKSDANGRFVFHKLSPDDEYVFMLSEEDEKFKMIIVDENGEVIEATKRLIDGKYRYVRLDADQNVITLINEIDEVIKIAENENFIISKVLYEYRSIDINEVAALELDKLVLILHKNKNIGVELSSHTDAKGSDSYNLNLSQKRADKAVEYIVAKGINKDRIVAKGYGESNPVAENTLKNGEDNPEGRAINRRTEFKVIQLN